MCATLERVRVWTTQVVQPCACALGQVHTAGGALQACVARVPCVLPLVFVAAGTAHGTGTPHAGLSSAVLM